MRLLVFGRRLVEISTRYWNRLVRRCAGLRRQKHGLRADAGLGNRAPAAAK